MSGLISNSSTNKSKLNESPEVAADRFIKEYLSLSGCNPKNLTLRVSTKNFLELYGNGLIKNQQVKGGQYSGTYKGIKIEAKYR